MVVYWDLVLLFNFLVDYLLLFCTARLAGRHIARRRLAFGAALGGAYAAVQLLLPSSPLLLLPALAAVGAAAFYGSGRALKLTLLFFLCAGALAGAVVLLGQWTGGAGTLAYNLAFARLPWGTFFLAAGLSYLLFGIVFRENAVNAGNPTADAVITYRETPFSLRLLRDSGNTLTDTKTGFGVPVVDRHIFGGTLSEEELRALPRIHYCSLDRADGSLPLLYCEGITLDGVPLGPRAIALSERSLGGAGCAGLWCEGSERKETKNVQKALA